jgi:hypothetical protein
MTKPERLTQIESYGQAYQLLMNGLKKFPREMWQYRAAHDARDEAPTGAHDPWTIHEIIVHITDSEANSYIRCRRLIAEPGSTVLGYDENKWAADLHYIDQSADDALELFKWLRLKSYTLIKNLPESMWANSVMHSESGQMTLDDWLDTYERHVPDHLAQMQAVYQNWLKQGH